MKVSLWFCIGHSHKKVPFSVLMTTNNILLSCCFFGMFLKLILFLEDFDENIKAELINDTFCYQSLLTENHVVPKETATKYQGRNSFVHS